MKKMFLVFTVIMLVISLGACSSSDQSPNMGDSWEDSGYENENSDPEEPAPTTNDPELEGGEVIQTADIPALVNRKIIYRAELEMRVLDPEAVYSDIIDGLDTYNAYVESADITQELYAFTIRVLSVNFDDLVNEIKQTGDLVNFSKSSEDITNSYSTFQARLDSLQAQQTRIIALIDQATDLDTILALEEARQDIEEELNQVGDTLANYDSLIDYSTIEVIIREATQEVVVLPRTQSPNIDINEVGKNGVVIEIYNNDPNPIVINVDLYQNGEFIREYNETSFGEAKTVITMTDLDSFKEYTLKVTVVADEHRVSNEVTRVFETEKTYLNKVENIFIVSFNSLVTLFEIGGLAIVALSPYLIFTGVVGTPIFFLKKKGILNRWFPKKSKKNVIDQVKDNQKNKDNKE